MVTWQFTVISVKSTGSVSQMRAYCNVPFLVCSLLISATVPLIPWTVQTWGAATRKEHWFTLLPTRTAAQHHPQNTWRRAIARKWITLTTTTVLSPAAITAVSLAGCQTAAHTTPKTQKIRSTVTRTLTPSTTGGHLYQTSAENWRCSTVRNLAM